MADAAALAKPAISTFERYLSIWVTLCIVVGIALGAAVPSLFEGIAKAEVAKVNLPVAALVWLMIIPMLLKIDFGALGQVRQHLCQAHLLLSLQPRLRFVGGLPFFPPRLSRLGRNLSFSLFFGRFFAPVNRRRIA